MKISAVKIAEEPNNKLGESFFSEIDQEMAGNGFARVGTGREGGLGGMGKKSPLWAMRQREGLKNGGIFAVIVGLRGKRIRSTKRIKGKKKWPCFKRKVLRRGNYKKRRGRTIFKPEEMIQIGGGVHRRGQHRKKGAPSKSLARAEDRTKGGLRE